MKALFALFLVAAHCASFGVGRFDKPNSNSVWTSDDHEIKSLDGGLVDGKCSLYGYRFGFFSYKIASFAFGDEVFAKYTGKVYLVCFSSEQKKYVSSRFYYWQTGDISGNSGVELMGEAVDDSSVKIRVKADRKKRNFVNLMNKRTGKTMFKTPSVVNYDKIYGVRLFSEPVVFDLQSEIPADFLVEVYIARSWWFGKSLIYRKSLSSLVPPGSLVTKDDATAESYDMPDLFNNEFDNQEEEDINFDAQSTGAKAVLNYSGSDDEEEANGKNNDGLDGTIKETDKTIDEAKKNVADIDKWIKDMDVANIEAPPKQDDLADGYDEKDSAEENDDRLDDTFNEVDKTIGETEKNVADIDKLVAEMGLENIKVPPKQPEDDARYAADVDPTTAESRINNEYAGSQKYNDYNKEVPLPEPIIEVPAYFAPKPYSSVVPSDFALKRHLFGNVVADRTEYFFQMNWIQLRYNELMYPIIKQHKSHLKAPFVIVSNNGVKEILSLKDTTYVRFNFDGKKITISYEVASKGQGRKTRSKFYELPVLSGLFYDEQNDVIIDPLNIPKGIDTTRRIVYRMKLVE